MEPSSTVGVAVARSIGKIGSAALSRYKPVGVARVGSPEDRAQAYKRLLDALVHHQMAGQYANITAPRGVTDPLFVDAVNHLMTAGSELLAALAGVQLCAPGYVINTAQKAVDAAQSKEGDEGIKRYRMAQVAFLEAARYDLEYNAKRWQLWKKRKARKFAETTSSRP
ncbi:hypothetical protein AB0C39_04950 [Streptomyces parvulus]|uniref:hypothetical protein n=1 Tax=Streptomyces parvulus TaxID=146923 RepID=UPI00340EBE57